MIARKQKKIDGWRYVDPSPIKPVYIQNSLDALFHVFHVKSRNNGLISKIKAKKKEGPMAAKHLEFSLTINEEKAHSNWETFSPLSGNTPKSTAGTLIEVDQPKTVIMKDKHINAREEADQTNFEISISSIETHKDQNLSEKNKVMMGSRENLKALYGKHLKEFMSKSGKNQTGSHKENMARTQIY